MGDQVNLAGLKRSLHTEEVTFSREPDWNMEERLGYNQEGQKSG